MKPISLGCSLYADSSVEQLREITGRAQAVPLSYVFTSLHIPEEKDSPQNFLEGLIGQVHPVGLQVIADISPMTLERLGFSNCLELLPLGVDWWRVDYGFDADQLVALGRQTRLMLNATLLEESLLQTLEREKIPLENLAACHNFYPKPYSGVGMERVKHQNRLCHHYGLPVFGFISGDDKKRGPIEKGLPTVEETRYERPLVAALRLILEAETDVVLVGDPSCSAATWDDLARLAQSTVQLRVNLEPGQENWYGLPQQERQDSSEYVIRSVLSREYAQTGLRIPNNGTNQPRRKGSIWLANSEYKRYSGELEIARVDLPADPWQNYLGQVIDADLPLLPFIRQGMNFTLINDKEVRN